MPFPDIDPVLFQIGPVAVRWYSLAYIFGVVLGIYVARRIARSFAEFHLSSADVDDFGFWSVLGIILGGRLGYVALYNPGFYLENPVEIVKTWNGGMSFHGGLVGVAVVAVLFCWRRRIRLLDLSDVVVCVAPIGLFLGRLANFVNGELWGRSTSLPWGVVFPQAGGALPRHPSQLYEATLEGVVLLLILGALVRAKWARSMSGFLTGTFLALYGVFRILVEFTREPDAPLLGPLTRGQAYSLPMVVIGAWLLCRALVVTRRQAM